MKERGGPGSILILDGGLEKEETSIRGKIEHHFSRNAGCIPRC